MRGEDLSREQLERLEREVERQHHYYVLLWKRAQANDMPLQDPLVRGICDTWAWINHLAQTIERLKARLPQPYRPLVSRGVHGPAAPLLLQRSADIGRRPLDERLRHQLLGCES